MASFVHLHNHSYYSIQEGINSPQKILDRAKELGFDAFALTDNNAMYGIMEFYQYAKSIGIKPIIGLELSMAYESRFRKDPVLDKKTYKIILLAKTYKGYQNLCAIISSAFLEGFYYKPRGDWELLSQYKDDLICIIHNRSSDITIDFLEKSKTTAIETLKKYVELFDKSDLYLELLHRPNNEYQKKINDFFIELSSRFDIDLVATNDTYYSTADENDAFDVMNAIQMQTIINDPKRPDLTKIDASIVDEQTMKNWFKDTPQALENTIKVAQMCNVEMPKLGWVFPEVKLDEDCKDTYEMLLKYVYGSDGIEKRLGRKPNENELKRLQYELDIIKQKGFVNYFLIVKEVCDFMEKNNIMTNTRGSAAGSFVSYALGITRANPLFFDLPFERFLNPLRPKAPDIDLDIEHIHRDRVVQWTIQRYGKDKVAQIVTFGTMAARNAFKDVARVFGKQFEETNKIAKYIPVHQGKSDLKKALEEVPQLKKLYEEREDYRKIFDIALKLEGCVRHTSQHACGILVTPKPCVEYLPLSRDPNNNPVSQYDQRILEDMGLLKMDYLGLKNLTIISEACNLIKKRHNIEINPENIPLDDKKTFELLSKAQTFGVFQLESPGMRKYLEQLKPTDIFDIQAMVALYRPGPIDNIPEYIARKNGQKPVQYLHPDLEPILKRTYGVLVYQDDVLLIAIKFGGYDWGEVDAFRKAMGKKIPKIMQEQRDKFIQGCIKNNYDEELAKKMFDLFSPFAAYGFNKAHAASYAMIAYQTAYLKANYPTEFMACLLKTEAESIDNTVANISECKKMGIKILPPDINESLENFTVIDEKAIRFGLLAIKGIGENAVLQIIQERQKNGNYKSLGDFVTRHDTKIINKKTMESLIKSGALDIFGDRKLLLNNLEHILIVAKKNNENKHIKNNMNLFDIIEKSDDEIDIKLYDNGQRTSLIDIYNYEKEVLGLCISIDIFDFVSNSIKEKIYSISQITEEMIGENIQLIGMFKNIKIIQTKKNEEMSFALFSDGASNIDVTFFPSVYKKYKDNLSQDFIYIIKGKVEFFNDKYKIIVSELKKIDIDNITLNEVKKNIEKKEKDNSLKEEVETMIINIDNYSNIQLMKFKDLLSKCRKGKLNIHFEKDNKIIKTNIFVSKKCIEDILKKL